MNAHDMLRAAAVDGGDTARLHAMVKKASEGKPITIAFLGGSITAGCNASSKETRYVELVHAWFRCRFPSSTVKCVNAGVGATTSLIGAHRVERDVLSHNPDLVVLDFAVNDSEAFIFRESYESLVCRLMAAPSAPAVLSLFMIIEGGKNVQDQQMEICRCYRVPMISYRNLMWSLLAQNVYQWKDVSTDEVHPNDTGHRMTASLITAFLEEIQDAPATSPSAASLSVPFPSAPVFGRRYMQGKILNAAALVPSKSSGFVRDGGGFQVFADGWKCRKGGGTLGLAVEGANISVLYKKTTQEGSGTLTILSPEKISVETFFPGGWGDYAETIEIIHSEKSAVHNLLLEADGPVSILGFLVS